MNGNSPNPGCQLKWGKIPADYGLYCHRETSEEAYRLAAEPKKPFILPAGHVDLYDRVNLIPFDKLANFFSAHLK